MRAALSGRASGLGSPTEPAVRLIAVSKAQSAEAIREAFRAGQRAFGENYAQEGLAKIAALRDLQLLGIEWHFIGPLQSNKARLVAEQFSWVQTLDRASIVEKLARHVNPTNAPLNVCIQVNVSGESNKSGVAPQEVLPFAKSVTAFSNLKLRGLMTIIENVTNEAIQRAQFREMHQLFLTLNQAGYAIDTLSMGMSHDFPVAIEEGSTMIRVGRALFGERN